MDVKRFLTNHGPGLTSELIEAMTKSGISSATARQRVTRAQAQYTRLAGIRFAKNARFIYLEEQYGGPDFWSAIERAFKASGQSYWATVVGLKARGGRCPKSMFPSVCGAPLARNRQLSPDRVLERLCAIQLLEENTDAATGETYVQFRPHSYHKMSEAGLKATLIAEAVALQAIRQWARRLGFGSYGKFLIRGEDDLPVVSGVAWDITAPSYMRPLVSARGGTLKPGFFVCDLNLNGPLDEDAVALFIRKHDMASAPQNVAPILPFLIGEVFTQAAFDLARKAGIVATTVSDLFGTDVGKALRNLIDLLSDAGATAAVNPQHLYNVMAALTKIEGAADNLRGALFELAIGSLVKDIEGGYLLTGQKWKDYVTGQSAEVDVLLYIEQENKLLIIECKSKIPGARVDQTDVEKWYANRVPLIERLLRQEQRYASAQIRFELWSNGFFSDDALVWLQAQSLEFPTHSLGWKQGNDLKDYARRAPSAAIRKTLNEHYFLHPMAKIESRRKREAASSKHDTETSVV
jgi:hypothetical protein